jgi:hypothetical protein
VCLLSGGGNAANWITAIATALTAAFAVFGSSAAWLTYRRDVRKDLPVIDADTSWSGDSILVRMRIRNPLPTTIMIIAARVKHPRNSLISPGFEVNQQGRYDLTKPKPANFQSTRLNHEIHPYESAVQDYSVGLDLAVFPLSLWDGGKFAIELTIIDKSSVTRISRITVQRRMPPRPHNNTDDIARSVD